MSWRSYTILSLKTLCEPLWSNMTPFAACRAIGERCASDPASLTRSTNGPSGFGSASRVRELIRLQLTRLLDRPGAIEHPCFLDEHALRDPSARGLLEQLVAHVG